MLKTIKYTILFFCIMAACQALASPDLLSSFTPAQQALLQKLDTTIHPDKKLLTKVVSSLTQQQLKLITEMAPNTKVTPALLGKIYKIAYNDDLSVKERAKKLKKLVGIHKPAQYIKRNICIWDSLGRNGPIYQTALDQKSRIHSFGVDATMTPYTDEAIAVADLKAGKCDAALISGMRARTLIKFTGTIDAIGAMSSTKEMRTLLYILSRPRMSKYMVQGPFVNMGILSAGPAYIFVNNRNINTLGKAAGKKVSVLNYDKVQARLVATIGATPVPSTLFSGATKFNNGIVDILPAPLASYTDLELYKGMTPDGGIINYPLAELTLQLIGRRSAIPNVIAQLIREAFYNRFDRVNALLMLKESAVPDHWWVEIPDKEKWEYQYMMQQARLELRDEGYYSGKMLTIERKVRCKYHPDNQECTNPVE